MFTPTTWATWIGYGLSGLVILFMLFDGSIKLVPLDIVITATAELGYPASVGFARSLGILGLACTALYAYPRTSVLGAILLTGYLGGAVATHVRVQGGWFAILFPVFVGALIWGGLYLRDARLRALVPLRS
jgi:DoxX-like family